MRVDLEVELKDRSYPIHVGPNILDDSALYTPHLKGRQVLIVTDENVGPRYGERIRAALSDYDIHTIALPAGEHTKTLSTLQSIFDVLLEQRFNRAASIIALGGGVVGDMAGFAAACYQRGIDFIQIPTTLLAQVDSSVGGKTAVNHPLGKNMIGAFYQPKSVIADTTTLDTLSDRELSAGLAEVIKYGVLWDGEFFDWLESNMAVLLKRDAAALTYAIRRSCEIKALIVARDERERDERALLNLGHTFGHAIEAGMGYGAWLHGEAVAAGMHMAADLAQRMGWISQGDVGRVRALIEAADLPYLAPAEIDEQTFLSLMAVDKKAVDGGIRLVLPTAIGATTLTADFDANLLRETLASCRTQ
ncbi:MAG: 3-dehydroquinate synthase [Gammaproteobacteria bacterium]|nr:3-dehydroquinate synthase [Gammaproteobacteria bacterium]